MAGMETFKGDISTFITSLPDVHYFLVGKHYAISTVHESDGERSVLLTSATFDPKSPERLTGRESSDVPKTNSLNRHRDTRVRKKCHFLHIIPWKSADRIFKDISELYLCFPTRRAAEATVHRSGPSLQTPGPCPSGRWAGVETGSLTARALWVVV